MQSGLNSVRVCLVGLLCVSWNPEVSAQPAVYEEGIHYQALSVPLPDTDPERIEITELFWYGCPRCYDLLPTIQLWEASYRSSDMTFSRMPVIWNAAMATHARVFFAADDLGLMPPVNKSSWMVTRSFHNDIYDAINSASNPLYNDEDIYALFATKGVSRNDFDATWNSETVLAKITALNNLPLMSEIASLPALVVNNRYVVTLNQDVQTLEEMFKVMNFIMIGEREERNRLLRSGAGR